MAASISSMVPGSNVLINKVPKVWVDYDIYCQLVPNNDSAQPNYQMIPRTGAFEVSFKGVVSAFFQEHIYKRYLSLADILEAIVGTLASLRIRC